MTEVRFRSGLSNNEFISMIKLSLSFGPTNRVAQQSASGTALKLGTWV